MKKKIHQSKKSLSQFLAVKSQPWLYKAGAQGTKKIAAYIVEQSVSTHLPDGDYDLTNLSLTTFLLRAKQLVDECPLQ